MTRYSLLINVTTDRARRYLDGYEPRDPLVRTYGDEVAAPVHANALNQIFARHNRDDRPDGRLGPSLSVGDVVLLDDSVAYSVDLTGFSPIPSPLFIDVETRRTWSEVIRAQEPRP